MSTIELANRLALAESRLLIVSKALESAARDNPLRFERESDRMVFFLTLAEDVRGARNVMVSAMDNLSR